MRAALFDMDGTLVRSEEIWISALVESLKKRGAAPEWLDVAQCEFGRPWDDCYRNVRDRWPEYCPSQAELGGETDAYYHDYILHNSIAIPESVELLRRLRKSGWKIAIVSGSCRTMVLETMKLIDVEDCLDLVIAAEDVKNGKPAPDPFLVAAERLGVLPGDCVVFEDSRAGVLSAKAAAMHCVALKRPADYPYQEDLTEADEQLERLTDFAEQGVI